MGLRNEIIQGRTSKIITVTMRSSTNANLLTGLAFGALTIWYTREGEESVQVTVVTMTDPTTWVSGGWVECADAGVYAFGAPNAAFASGSEGVTFTFRASGALHQTWEAALVAADMRNADSLGLSRIDVAVGTREAETDAATSAAADIAEHDTTQAAIGGLPAAPSVSAIADGVWDEALAGHLAAGSSGSALSTASAGGVDTGALAAAVWGSAERTLTAFNFETGGGGSSGGALEIRPEMIREMARQAAEAVWEWEERTLTAFGFTVEIEGVKRRLDQLHDISDADIRAVLLASLEVQGYTPGRAGNLDFIDGRISDLPSRAGHEEALAALHADSADRVAELADKLTRNLNRTHSEAQRAAHAAEKAAALRIPEPTAPVDPMAIQTAAGAALEERGLTVEALRELAGVSHSDAAREEVVQLRSQVQGMFRDLREQLYRWLFLGTR